jgi:polyketide biosynthesis enoyl-CoA hydratase PksI
MEDREHRNTFSAELIEGLMGAFGAIGADESVRAVVIHGYDSYFCSGGSKEELLRIIGGKLSFDELGFYRLLLDCPVPTIAAMQGHAIGGGLAFGTFADSIVLAEESIYTANFMNYGFTPGMGATCILPTKLGTVLGTEMLYTARAYQGGELKSRGVNAIVTKRGEVIREATALALEIAAKPRQSLIALKTELTRSLKVQVAEAVNRELAMHQVTLKEPSVQARVEALFAEYESLNKGR